jgi:hypothetical protein
MDDNQLDQLFRQELEDFQAPDTGAEANWARLQERVAKRKRGGWWVWLLALLLLAGGTALALSWLNHDESTPVVPLAMPQPPDNSPPDVASAQTPSQVQPQSAPVAQADHQPEPAVLPAPARPPEHSQPERLAISGLETEAGLGTSRSGNDALSADAAEGNAFPPVLTEKVALATSPQEASTPLLKVDSLAHALPSLTLATLVRPVVEASPSRHQEPRWRWLPRVGLSLARQYTWPGSGRLEPWPPGLRLALVERGAWALETGLYVDRYYQGDPPRGSNAFAQSDTEWGGLVIPVSTAPPPDSVLSRVWRIDAPGLMLPLSLSFAPPLSVRWQPVVQAGLLLRYQLQPSLRAEYVLVPDIGGTGATGDPGAEANRAAAFPNSTPYRGWQVSGWQAAAGVRVRLRPHLSMQVEGYYQSRRAFDLPEQTPFHLVGLRATFWWER